jgi:hypothetical protein
MTPGCMYVVRYDGTYSGRVVDADTREPIEGAVVLGTWYTERPTVAGAVHEYYDARETLTDKDGGFSIHGQGLRIFSKLLPMSVLIFKAGYSYENEGIWDASLKAGLYSKDRIKWEDDKPIFSLKKLTIEERKKQGSPDYPSEAPEQKRILMLKEINKDRIERGLKPVSGVHSYYDSRETVTDKDGQFYISGMGLRIMSNLEPMDILIFKIGYEHVGSVSWASFKEDPTLNNKIHWKDSTAIIPLKKWTVKERLNRFGSYYVSCVPDEKQRLLLKEVEKENKEIGK